MSAPIHDLLKRPDELFVVEHAHLRPRFVEDSVRHALRDALDTLPELEDEDFLLSKQVNYETIHTHDVVAERFGTVGELRGELRTGTASPRQTTLAPGSPASTTAPPPRVRPDTRTGIRLKPDSASRRRARSGARCRRRVGAGCGGGGR